MSTYLLVHLDITGEQAIFGEFDRLSILSPRMGLAKLVEIRTRMRKLLLAGLNEARDGRDAAAAVMGYCFNGAAALELARSGEAKDI